MGWGPCNTQGLSVQGHVSSSSRNINMCLMGKSLQASSNPLYEESLPYTHHPSDILQNDTPTVYHQHASECLGYHREQEARSLPSWS